MKFHFNFDIAGIKNISENGSQKIWDGAKMHCECEAEVNELISILKDRQISADKMIVFFKEDLHNVIKNCGKEIINLERENRKMNAEIPSNGMRSLIEENKKLQERIKDLNERNDHLHSELSEAEDRFMDEHLNKISAREQISELKAKLEEKEMQFNSLQADMEGTMTSFREMENNYNDLKKKIEEKAKARKEWSETIA